MDVSTRFVKHLKPIVLLKERKVAGKKSKLESEKKNLIVINKTYFPRRIFTPS